MMRTAILLGDPTSSGGTVVTATSGLPNNGTIVATLGDMVFCTVCNTKAPIIALNEVAAMMPNGKQVALEGDMVDCRCSPKPTLIATIATFRVEDSRSHPQDWPMSVGHAPKPSSGDFDEHFKIINAKTNKPLAHTKYAIKREDGTVEYGTTDVEGTTHLLSQTAKSEDIEIFLEE